jgi:hypothetical protein
VPNEGSAKSGELPVEEEKRGLYASIGSFIDKDWYGLGIFPNPADRLQVRFVSLRALFIARAPVLNS